MGSQVTAMKSGELQMGGFPLVVELAWGVSTTDGAN